ncbi:DNA-directed DNA polymerase gamma mip1, partial [Marasmius crinis-equi]
MVNTSLFRLLLCPLIGPVCFSSPRLPNESPVVDLGYAQYQGVYDSSTNVTDYRGVRYAAPPTGDLRWRAPQAPEHVSGVQQASTDPPSCFQAPSGGPSMVAEVAAETEDCLFL